MAKFCSNCGKELNDGATFCSNCGKQILNTQTIKNKTQSIKFFISAVCAIVLSIVCAITAGYLNATALTGNARKFVNSSALELRDTMQSITAYGFIVFLIVAIILFVIGIVLRQKERANKQNLQ